MCFVLYAGGVFPPERLRLLDTVSQGRLGNGEYSAAAEGAGLHRQHLFVNYYFIKLIYNTFYKTCL